MHPDGAVLTLQDTAATLEDLPDRERLVTHTREQCILMEMGSSTRKPSFAQPSVQHLDRGARRALRSMTCSWASIVRAQRWRKCRRARSRVLHSYYERNVRVDSSEAPRRSSRLVRSMTAVLASRPTRQPAASGGGRDRRCARRSARWIRSARCSSRRHTSISFRMDC
jgi:hypothetical protein